MNLRVFRGEHDECERVHARRPVETNELSLDRTLNGAEQDASFSVNQWDAATDRLSLAGRPVRCLCGNCDALYCGL